MSFNASDKLLVNVNPAILEDINMITEFWKNFFINKDLKQYRPHRRPITRAPEHLANDPAFIRKRKLIVRDWFFYVVWYVRLRKIMKNYYSTEVLQQELETNSKYADILKVLENPNASIKDLKDKLTGG